MNLVQAIRRICQNYISTIGLTDTMVAKVVSVNPISIAINNSIDPITNQSIKLTQAVVEKTIDIVEHQHSYEDDNGEGVTTKRTETALQNVQVYENGKPLGRNKENTRLIINKGLEVGDEVLVLMSKQGKEFIILSRLY